MIKLLRIPAAVFEGTSICFGDPVARRLALKPWGMGLISYVFFGIGAIYAHGPLLHSIISEPSSFWGEALSFLLSLLIICFLLIGSMVLCLVVVFSIGGIYHTQIAEHVLREKGVAVPNMNSGLGGLSKELWRTVKAELFRLAWVLPLSIILLLLGLIPLLTVPVVVFTSWLLAYGSFDLVLDALKIPARKRLKFALSNCLSLSLFGLSLMACALIPFVALFLPPIAVAGAASLYPGMSTNGRSQ